MGIFSKIKEKLKKNSAEYLEDFKEEYVEIDTTKKKAPDSKIMIKSFVLEDFPDIKPALDALREGYTIALINIRPLKEKDIVELKRAVAKLKKTCDAIEGDIAGFGEDWVVATPKFATIHRGEKTETIESVESAS